MPRRGFRGEGSPRCPGYRHGTFTRARSRSCCGERHGSHGRGGYGFARQCGVQRRVHGGMRNDRALVDNRIPISHRIRGAEMGA
jgi:hypothetical protein